jgi:D-beta-D-heptose 7-phosphate kinase / D-beta-D-heptose 1-phosphate adenosyltransferase
MSASILRHLDLQTARVLVIGDLMLDRFRYGSASRISPEAPVPVLHIKRERTMLGGAGNVLANISSLGARGALIAVIGNDEAGRACAELVIDMGGDPELLVTTRGRPTSLKTRFISGSQQLLRCDEEDSSPIAESVELDLLARFDAVIEDFDVVAISDYAKGVLSNNVLRHVISRARMLGKAVVVDPKRRDFSAYAGATVIKPNRSELGAFSGRGCDDFADCAASAEAAISVTGASILVTLSEQGMALFREGRDPMHLQAAATEVFDVSGAGDTALAVFCSAISAGLEMEEATMLANAGAGAVVRKLGTATLSDAELASAVSSFQGAEIGVVRLLDQALQQVELWKQEGLRVGFTNGCFDILHAGHIEILRRAKACCDRLIVGLNSDSSISRLKGPARPIQSESSRAAVLAAIDAVDLVIVFDDDTPIELIKTLRPTDLCKGADYSEDEVVGAAEVKAEGGRVHLIDLVPGFSTTNAVEKIRQSVIA